MPLLVAADVRIMDDLSADMRASISDGGRSVLFEGLSGAMDLKLTSDPRVS
ncbi:hypothetical protein ACP70R_003813 [Stipagrostis hirtigluma subsp. patula]